MSFRSQAVCGLLLISLLLKSTVAFAEPASDYRGIRPMDDFAEVVRVADIAHGDGPNELIFDLLKAMGQDVDSGLFDVHVEQLDPASRGDRAAPVTWEFSQVYDLLINLRIWDFPVTDLHHVTRLHVTGNSQGNVFTNEISSSAKTEQSAPFENLGNNKHAVWLREEDTYRPTKPRQNEIKTHLELATSLSRDSPIVFPTASSFKAALRTTEQAKLPPGIARLVMSRTKVVETRFGRQTSQRRAYAVLPFYRAKPRLP